MSNLRDVSIMHGAADSTGLTNAPQTFSTKKSIKAGGPGSGRHAGETPVDRAKRLRESKMQNYQKNLPKPGKPVNMSNHSGLTDNGYKHKGNISKKGKEVSVYEHPNHYGSRILVHESGRTVLQKKNF